MSTNTLRYTMCSAPNVYMFVYTLIGAHIVPLSSPLLLVATVAIYTDFKGTIRDPINM